MYGCKQLMNASTNNGSLCVQDNERNTGRLIIIHSQDDNAKQIMENKDAAIVLDDTDLVMPQ